ncbi:hypothetical protein LCGC14_1042480 [marine sediment metagenome]|uniref:Uncharacterized protein n=1 Tax=marine sediment metagenome TaxID=412755 RepID=A0A0F9MR96_9ZZZZ
MSHTPGPWKAVRLTHGWIIGPQPDGVCTIHNNTNGSGFDQKTANARLIAAAPDLLEACEAMVHAARQGDSALGGVAATLAEAAITKATQPPAATLAGAPKEPTETD